MRSQRRSTSEWQDVSSLTMLDDRLYFIGGRSDRLAAIVSIGLNGADQQIVAEAGTLDVDPQWFSSPEPIEFASRDGATAHAYFYPPRNPETRAAPGELPPLLVMSHGGPTVRRASIDQLSNPVLHQPRLGRRGRELRRFERLRARLPRAPRRSMGCRRCARLRRRRRASGADRSHRCEPRRDPRRQRRRLYDAGGIDVRRDVSRRREPLRNRRSRNARP